MLRAIYAPFLVALSFLTLLPVGVANPTDAEISRSRGWYPFVGLMYGLILAFLAITLPILLGVLPWSLLTAALLVAALAVFNRFLHLDGLMDFCDAMWGGHTAERRLEIMRDSTVGAFAVAGAGCVLLVKLSALSSQELWHSIGLSASGWLSYASLIEIPQPWWVEAGLNALLLFPMVSRWTMTLLLTVFPYGRQDGIGTAFVLGGRPWLATALAFLSVAAVAWFLLGLSGVIVLTVSSALALLLGAWMARRLGGGLTGDCYGATNEIIEAFALTLLVPLASSPLVFVGYGSGIAYDFPWWTGWAY